MGKTSCPMASRNECGTCHSIKPYKSGFQGLIVLVMLSKVGNRERCIQAEVCEPVGNIPTVYSNYPTPLYTTRGFCMDYQASVLVVDDEPDNFDVIETLLSREQYYLNYASNGLKLFDRLHSAHPDVILLDVMMPDVDGIEVCRQIKANAQWQHIPIIMVTALTAKEDLARCLDAGADDFISKPVNGVELRARVRSMLRISKQHRNIQNLCQQLQQANQILEDQVHQRTAQLQQRIYFDELTRLPSRSLLLHKLEEAIQTRSPQEIPQFALLYLDCDQFKLINGSLGHEVGDKLLIAIGDRLTQQLRPTDLLSRLGEDEFCVFLKNVHALEEIQSIAQQILQAFSRPFQIDGYEVFVTASLGIALDHWRYKRALDLLQDADAAMYRAKAKRKGCYEIFDQVMHDTALCRLQLENDLRWAIERQEFVVYYQPIVNLRTQKIIGFEALVRWQHPERGMVSPAEFIPCLEETGLIVPVGMLVLTKACQQLKLWHQTGFPDVIISVNLSVRQFAHPTLIEDIDLVLQETEVNSAYLKLEITESAIMDNAQAAVAIIKQLQQRQIQLSIDDFGTGYSSLSYLNRLPVDSLKIDRSFVNHIDLNHQNSEIVRSVVTLGHALGMSIVAEGIETTDQLAHLKDLGCQYGQGYFFAKPLDSQHATDFLVLKAA